MKWFSNPQTLEELQKQYKTLAKQHHPDCGGNTSNMQEINVEYDNLFTILKTCHTSTQETTAEQDKAYNQIFKDIISKIVNLVGVEIEIIGSWIWATGNTYQYKAILKELGFKWCKNKTAWAWHDDSYKKKSKKQFNMDEIRTMFNAKKVSIKNNHTLVTL